MSFTSFEHELLKIFKKDYSDLKSVWISCSFGVDSLVLLESLKNINPVLKLDINVVHIHHGQSESSDQLSEYRDLALDKTKKYCKANHLVFKFFKSETKLSSEKEYRDFRLSCYKKLKNTDEKSLDNKANILLGHHKQDHLETLMLKLIRGVGPQGFKFDDLNTNDFNLLRPLLCFSKDEILEQAHDKKLDFLEDPTNKRDDFLRNWLRNKWLKDLEEKRAGSLDSLSESLSLLSDSLQKSSNALNKSFLEEFKNVIQESKISTSLWLSLNADKKSELVAQILNNNSDKGFSKGQITEVIKQLDLLQKEHRFRVAGLIWNKDVKGITFIKG